MRAYKTVIASALALSFAAPAMADEPPKAAAPVHPMQVWHAPETHAPAGVCLYASQPYSVGAVLDGRVCGYKSDAFHDAPDEMELSLGPHWRLPIRGEAGYVQPAGAK